MGKRVLDVGSGCGASAIASKLSGAAHVIANDIDNGMFPLMDIFFRKYVVLYVFQCLVLLSSCCVQHKSKMGMKQNSAPLLLTVNVKLITSYFSRH